MNEPTLPGFVEWLQRKDPNERYEWPQAGICACGQYAASLGKKDWHAASLGKKEGHGTAGIWSKLNRIARGAYGLEAYEASDPKHWTFGKCLERAKKELEPA